MAMELNDEDKSLIRSSLSTEEKILNLGLRKWGTKLKEFEEEHSMSSEEFLKKFNNGELGDDKKWFNWLFAYKAYIKVRNKLGLIRKISL
jgi:hypothetical protein